MDDIIIRKAKKDFVCDVCRHIIHVGDEYLDKVITHDGRAVRHERYHDECPCDKTTDLFKAIKDANYSLPCVDTDGNKWTAHGIIDTRVHVTSWDELETSVVSLSMFLKRFRW